jgi:hypothetical protein
MTATSTIVADPARDLIRITLAGFFDERSIADFLEARRRAHAQLRCGPNQHLTIADTRAIAIQTQDMVARWGGILADPAYRSRRLAFVTASTLARMQLQRAIGSRDAQVFTDPAEAEAWLFAPGPAAAAAA